MDHMDKGLNLQKCLADSRNGLCILQSLKETKPQSIRMGLHFADRCGTNAPLWYIDNPVHRQIILPIINGF